MYSSSSSSSTYPERYTTSSSSTRYPAPRQGGPPLPPPPPLPGTAYRHRQPSSLEEFPGPLHIPSQPRLPPSHSPSSSSYSSDSLRSPSPSPRTTTMATTTTIWGNGSGGGRGVETIRREKLPPIHHLTSSVDWHRDEMPVKFVPGSVYSSRTGADPRLSHHYHHHHHHQEDMGPDTYNMPPHADYTFTHDPNSHPSSSSSSSSPSSLPSTLKTSKFGIRRGSRFYCTYVSPITGERCATWDQGWTVYATLNRHAESDHAHEEVELINQGRLTYGQAQIVTSKEKQQRIEEHLATTGRCPDCGTVFSSNRKDSLTRHKQTSACEKAQKRGRPPTRFPKKPKAQGYQIMDIESDDGY